MNDSGMIGEIHWLLSVVQHVDVGLIVIDRHYRVKLWNAFMENHSGRLPNDAVGRELFELVPETPAHWLKNKIDSVFLLKNSSFSTWQQRPFVVKLRSYRPLTGLSEWMYQNVTFLPLAGITTEVEQVCLIIYDVTDMAISSQQLQALSRTDTLTHLLAVHAWEQQVAAELNRTMRTGTTSTLALIAIEHFSEINHKYGHQAGDEVIRTLAHLMVRHKRESDIPGRYGEHQFGLILTDTDEEGALSFFERLQQGIQEVTITYSHHNLPLVVTMGLAETPTLGSDKDIWLERAEIALSEATQRGSGVVSYRQMFLS